MCPKGTSERHSIFLPIKNDNLASIFFYSRTTFAGFSLQDVLGGHLHSRVPGLMGAGGSAGGLRLSTPSIHLCIGEQSPIPLRASRLLGVV